jgi:lipocalin
VIRPQWVWELDDAEGRVLDNPVSPIFSNQFDAEQWLGEHWRELAAQDVAVARLLHDGTQASAPVPLRVP